MTNLSNYGKYKYGKDDAPDSMSGLLSMMSESYDVDVDSFGSGNNDYERNKILDNEDRDFNDEPEIENDSSEIEIF
jgi:hypothetical protein